MKPISFYKIQSNFKSHILKSGKWIDGQSMSLLEERLKKYLNVKYLILTNSGTSALLAAYWVLKDKYHTLSVDPYTFPATYQPARILNYKINYVRTILHQKESVAKDSLQVVTHLFGQPNNLILNSGEDYIEDACQSFGAEISGKKVGTFGKIGCFSFYPTKSFHTCGHGGAVVTNDENYYIEMKKLIECGRLGGKMTESPGLNLRMDEIKAEFLLSEFENYEEKIEIQRNIAKEFIDVIHSNQPFLKEEKNQRHIYSIFNLLVERREEFREFLSKKLIDTIIYYGDEILPESEKGKYTDLTSKIVAIPCRWNLTRKEINRIKIALKEWFR
ncbi:MAG TPA: DegT/DnrJ/EryC1/StrS family aminotransferase [Candidatus Methanoperedens sp.]|nr:DegT/DnrJ/EryC1/StrS family aminotransferase [Candidatus Methanoperedens sp.]